MEFIERAFIDARESRPALAPFCDGVIPTTLDTSMNPDGTHIFSLFTQWVPSDWSQEPHVTELDAYADRIIELAQQKPDAPYDRLSNMRDLVGNIAEDLEGTNCSEVLIRRLNEGLGTVPSG